MDKAFRTTVPREFKRVITRWLRDPQAVRGDDWRFVEDAPAAEHIDNAARLPPTRAARTPRSRGVFLAGVEAAAGGRASRLTDVSIAAVAIAIVTIASVLIMSAPAAVMGVALNLNPGPALVGAASVPPSFLERSRSP
jgi:hypothetical protein